MPAELLSLEKELAQAKAEIEELKLRLSNVTFLLTREMTASGSLPKIDPETGLPTSNQGKATSN